MSPYVLERAEQRLERAGKAKRDAAQMRALGLVPVEVYHRAIREEDEARAYVQNLKRERNP